MSQKEGDGGPRRSARQSGKGSKSADGDAGVQEQIKDPASAETSVVTAEDSDGEVDMRMEAAEVSGGKMGSSPPAYGNDASRAALAGLLTQSVRSLCQRGGSDSVPRRAMET